MKLTKLFYALENLFFMLQHAPCDVPKYPELHSKKVQKCSEHWPESLQKWFQSLLDGSSGTICRFPKTAHPSSAPAENNRSPVTLVAMKIIPQIAKLPVWHDSLLKKS
jgi:hypothetical protein